MTTDDGRRDPTTRTDEDLVQVALELYARSCIYRDSKVLHDAWVEAKLELTRRLAEMRVPLTDKERQALNELSVKQDLPPERIMIQALQLYQMVVLEKIEIKPVYLGPMCADWGQTEIKPQFPGSTWEDMK